MIQIQSIARNLFSPLLILFFGVLISGSAWAQPGGFDKSRLSRIDSLIDRHIAAAHIPGATVLIIQNGNTLYNKAFGYADVATQRKMQTSDIFRIASQSKAITSLGVLLLLEEGKFLLDDPVANYIPAFKTPVVLTGYNPQDGSYTTRPARRLITIRDLLRHTSGIAYSAVFSDPVMWHMYEKAGIPSGIGTSRSTLKEKMELLATLPLQHDPGEAFTYGLNTDLLGYLIEIWSGQHLDTFLQQRVLAPLEMNDTYFHLPSNKQNRLVSLYETAAQNKLIRVTHPIYEGADPGFPKLQGTYLSGGAGLSSTTADMSNFYSMLLANGVFKGKQIISRKTVELLLTNQLTLDMKVSPLPPQPEHFAFTLGGFSLTTDANHYLSHRSIGSFGWGGAFNTHGWADPEEKLIVLLFTQEYLSPYFSLGDELQVAVYQALMN